MDKNILKIGDELWRTAFLSMLKYTVTGLREYSDNTQYELTCESCNHGRKCIVLAAMDSYGKPIIVQLLNYDEDDDQRAYQTHIEGDSPLFRTAKEARAWKAKRIIDDKKKNIENLQKQIVAEQNRIKELELVLGATQ